MKKILIILMLLCCKDVSICQISYYDGESYLINKKDIQTIDSLLQEGDFCERKSIEAQQQITFIAAINVKKGIIIDTLNMQLAYKDNVIENYKSTLLTFTATNNSLKKDNELLTLQLKQLKYEHKKYIITNNIIKMGGAALIGFLGYKLLFK